MDSDRSAPAARDALYRAARRAYALRAFDAAATHVGRAVSLYPADGDEPGERLRLDLFATEISFYRDRDAFLEGGGIETLSKLAETLYAHREQAHAARAWTLLGQAAWYRADRPAALSCLDRAVELFDELPDTAEKADAYAELGRLHMLNYERDPAVAAAGAAAEIAQRLGLVEAQAHACIIVATARYQAGEPSGLDELTAAVEMCRNEGLFALGRAIRNLAFAVGEEGDMARSNELLSEAERMSDGPGLGIAYSDEANRAFIAGDFDRLLDTADAFVDTPGGRWDTQVIGRRSVVRVLRGDADANNVADAVSIARGSGFHRPLWTILSLGALCRALQGRVGEAEDLLAELSANWRTVPAMVSGEWVDAAAFASALAGPVAAQTVWAMVSDAPRSTRWSEAALATAAAGLAAAAGDHARAAELHTRAATIYAGIGHETDRMFAQTLSAREWRLAGNDAETELALTEVRAFASRNRVPALLAIAEQAATAAGGSAGVVAAAPLDFASWFLIFWA
jgi:tetratricopeptide (TPR) repeat protein